MTRGFSTYIPEPSPDRPPVVLNPADDFFDVGTSIDTAGTRFSGATPWTWQNQGGAAAPIADGNAIVIVPGSASDDFRIIKQPVPASPTPWKYRTKISAVNAQAGGFTNLGLVAINGNTNGFMFFGIAYNGNYGMEISYWDNVTTFGGFIANLFNNLYFSSAPAIASFPFYLEIESDGTNIIFRYSVSGADNTFVDMFSETIAAHLVDLTHIGFAVNATPDPAYDALMAADWFRRMS